MEFLYILEGLRTPLLDQIFSVLTHLGDETAFLAVAIMVVWCVSKRSGYYLMTVGLFGLAVNQFLKLVCRVPRPWARDPAFTVVESARERAGGYSFPSGHTQNAAAVFGSTARAAGNTAVRIVCVAVIVLVALSRMYLGVHTPADVLTSLGIGAVLVFALWPAFRNSEENPVPMYIAMAALAACSALFVLFVEVYPWPADIDPDNLASGVKNAYLLLGASSALLLAVPVERRFLRFDTRAPFGAQVLKVLLGLALLLGLKAGLKSPLLALCGGHDLATALRYFLLVIFAALVWPLTFRWFADGCPVAGKPRLRAIWRALAALIAVVGLVFWALTRNTSAAPIDTDDAENPLITSVGTTMLSGHRAGAGIAPEHTMLALRNCAENEAYEVDVLELDLHLTADDVLVLLHDATLDRTSDAVAYFGEENVEVGEKTYEELRGLNMGAQFETDSGEKPYAGLSGEAVPEELRIVSLGGALEYLESQGEYRYVLEIKDAGERGHQAADVLYETLTAYDCLERAVVATFHNEVTAYMDTTYPDMPRSAGFNEVAEFYFRSLLGLEREDGWHFVALQIPTRDYVVNLGTSRLVNYAHEHDIAVQYWTINDPEEIAYLQSIGADAIMTDVPDIASSILTRP